MEDLRQIVQGISWDCFYCFIPNGQEQRQFHEAGSEDFDCNGWAVHSISLHTE